MSQDIVRAPVPDDARVMIIGSHGFVGKNLIFHLQERSKYKVFLLPKTICDVMNYEALFQSLLKHEPDVVINLAAFVGGIGLNKEHPADMIYRNLIMSSNVVQGCYKARIRKLIFLGSVCSYPHTPPRIPFYEDDLWIGRPEPTNEPYGVAKKTIGLMLATFREQFGFPSAYLIPTNMYGPFDNFKPQSSHVIPAMIKQFIEAQRDGTEVVHWGDGTATRDFLFVDDCCQAIMAAIKLVDDPTPINVGSGQECPISELSSIIAKEVGFTGQIRWDRNMPNGQPRRWLNIDRAKSVLGFQPKTTLVDGIRQTVNYYRQYVEKAQ